MILPDDGDSGRARTLASIVHYDRGALTKSANMHSPLRHAEQKDIAGSPSASSRALPPFHSFFLRSGPKETGMLLAQQLLSLRINHLAAACLRCFLITAVLNEFLHPVYVSSEFARILTITTCFLTSQTLPFAVHQYVTYLLASIISSRPRSTRACV
jgi:hypothetical protein